MCTARKNHYCYTGIIDCAHKQQEYNWSLFYDVLQFKSCAYAVLIEIMSV